MSIQTANQDTFRQMIAQDFVVVDFYGTTCGPCKLFARILEDIEAELPFLQIVKLNVTENPEIAKAYHVAAVPTVHFYKDGVLVDSHVSLMQAEQVKAVIAKYLYA